MFSRRQFCQTAVASAASIAAVALSARVSWALDADNPYRNDIGIQLYTLRDAIGEDAGGTLAKVAELGYKQVEPYGFPDCDNIINAAQAAGLPIRSSHFNADGVITQDDAGGDDFKRTVEKANSLGLHHLVIPYVGGEHRKNLDDYKRMAMRFNKAADIAADADIQLAYHNHAFEFQPMDRGRRGYDVFSEEFSDQMKFEVDVFWVQVAGVDPVSLMEKLSGRISQLHLKDLAKSVVVPSYDGVPNDGFKELGNGVVAIEPIIEKASAVGVKHCHVEQDHSPHPIQSVQESLEYLAKL